MDNNLDDLLEKAAEYGEVMYIDIGSEAAEVLADKKEDFMYKGVQFWIAYEQPQRIEVHFFSGTQPDFDEPE